MIEPKLWPEWSADVAFAMHRMGIAAKEVASECQISDSWFSTIMRTKFPSDESKKTVEAGLARCAEKRGVELHDIFPISQGLRQSTDP